MGFQGDVAGLGLGELLQGLARGGREGVLTLRGGGKTARLGVESGQIHLLPEADEDPGLWRKRCERAWAGEPDQRIDGLRMSEIAHAARMETMFELLDCEGVHFRFEPGPLPSPRRLETEPPAPDASELGRMETGAPIEAAIPVHCAAISVEFLLLEYARLSDELQTHPAASTLSAHAVPTTLSSDVPGKGLDKLWRQCDGASNLGEMADRLGWPLRQVRATVYDLLERGYMRCAEAPELLELCRRELGLNRFARAAARLAGWCESAAPGPPTQADAELLLGEWERGKLPVVLASMSPRVARGFLRRLDLAANNVVSSVARWQELRKYHRHDAIAEVRLLHWQCRSENEADAPAMTDLLRVARKFQESGQRLRAAAMLRAAAARGPETTAMRLELGQRMLSVGLLDEGAPWILEAGRTLIDSGAPDKAVPPLRAALELAPNNRELRALFATARNKSTSGKRTRRNSLFVLSGVLVVALAAVVKVRFEQAYDRRYNEVADQSDRPEVALEMLERAFENDGSPRVKALRESLQTRIREQQIAARDAWLERYQSVQLECTLGDPLLGLKRALDLPAPPEGAPLTAEGWPTLATLLDGLAARIEQTLAEWGEPSDAQEAVHAEQRLARLVDDLLALIAGSQSTDLTEFHERVNFVGATLRGRDEARAKERERTIRAEQLEQQDMLLAAARAHAQANDLERSVATYRRLVAMPGSEQIAQLLASEITAVEAHFNAVVEARELARHGAHRQALERLAQACDDPREHLLPCRIDSLPQGARVRLPDGSTRTTPVVLDIAPGEKLALELEHEGCEPERIVIGDPADQRVLLSRKPERWWTTSASVEALPVSVDHEHVVCDRAGRIARLSRDTELVWSQEIDSLGGIARTPVFLPGRAGFLLVLTEDGAAWLVEAATGRIEGPWDASSPPIAGPAPVEDGVSATLSNGTRAVWQTRLKPELGEMPAEPRAARDAGYDAGLSVLRRANSLSTSLDCPWANWTVEVAPTHMLVRRRGQTEIGFSVRRSGEWNFLAWEAPHAKLPGGRLWISDGAGLRGFEP